MTSMTRIRPSLILLFAVASGASLCAFAQTDQSVPGARVREFPPALNIEEAVGGHVKTVPAPDLFPGKLPFSIDAPANARRQSISVLPENKMSREDQDLVADAQSSIQERAGFENMEFEGSGWNYDQLVCPALPKHIFLRFTHDDGTRQMSMFSAAIPRDGNGRVHIIPIVRRGYSLFSPAPIGALTIAAFNRIRAEEDAGASADWLGTGLCYAALAGANPQLGAMTAGDEEGAAAGTFQPTLTISSQGGAVIRFVDLAAKSKPMGWAMVFGSNGKLLKAEHHPTSDLRVEKSKAALEDPGQPK